MAKRAEDRKIYDRVPMEYFLARCRMIDRAGLNVTIKSENPESDGSVWFRLHHGMTMQSYGEKITITLRPRTDGTDVHILSECAMPTQIVDYGKNKQNCAAIFRYIDAGIIPADAPKKAAPQSPAMQQPVQQGIPVQQPSPVQPGTPVQQPSSIQPEAPMPGLLPYVFCTECGTKNERSSNFCKICGAKLLKL